MDLEQTVAALWSENQQLGRENEQWKLMLSVFKENQDLRARFQSFNNGCTMEELSVCSSPATRPSGLWQKTLDERHFRKVLQQPRQEHRSSSPVDLRYFAQNSMHTNPSDRTESESCHADIPPEIRGPVRLLGEIAYQLDRRVLSYIFQAQRRLYGFTLLNIPGKIIEVSAHPLTGKVDEGYRLHLARRYADLMERLNQLGYQATLHPPFTEFIVNTYGILKERPGEHSSQAMDYNNPDFLKKLIMTIAPSKLQKDLLLVLNCLCNMATRDKKQLILW